MRALIPLLTDARGSLGGTVFSRNPYGRYTRARTAPTQPRTPLQVSHRVVFATAAAYWRTLGRPAVAQWNAYAATLSHTDSLGQTSAPSGFTTFVSRWINRSLLSETGPPYIPSPELHAPVIPFTIAAATLTGGILLNLVLTSPNDFGGAEGNLVFAATPGLSPGITFVARTGYRTLGIGGSFISGTINIALLYNAVLPPPALSSIIRVRLRYVDASGLAGRFTFASKIVS